MNKTTPNKSLPGSCQPTTQSHHTTPAVQSPAPTQRRTQPVSASKNRLTTFFIHAFVRDCQTLKLSTKASHELMRCASQMSCYTFMALESKNDKDKAKNLFTALTYLNDCESAINSLKNKGGTALNIHLQIIQGRLTQIFESTSKSEGGQLRMFA